MLKKSQLWQVHTERSASGSYAASLEVPPPPAGTVLRPSASSLVNLSPSFLEQTFEPFAVNSYSV